MDKRASLRQYFEYDKANKLAEIKSDKLHADKLARMESIEETINVAISSLLDFMDKKTSKVELTNQLDSISTPDVENVVSELKNLAKVVISAKTDQKPVIDALNALKREITVLPAKIPHPKEQKDTIKVSNLSEVKFDTTNLEKVIKGLDLKVDAPIINVDKPDFKILEKLSSEVLSAIKGIKYPEIPVTDLTTLEMESKASNKKLDEANKHLKTIAEKKFGSSGGGGNGTPYTDSSGTAKNVILTTGGRIPVDIDMATEGIATEAKQDSQITQLANILIELTQKTEATQNQQVELINAIRLVLQSIANPAYVDKSANQMRSQVTGSLTAVTTVTTVTNLTNIGSFPADHLQRMDNMTAWATNVRQIIV